ncbi:hypothetical protein E1301_Tti016760 [Triplophysa tibetana]|uniref:Uncharacterized protein n=1 Tax=Triplophysa tibetana TaxID=1572043 RepID=A0A5A9P783_9TELE|nr:hypothetical protein E1301_Tti016760 [Triplophysa tibetana]
MAARFGLKFIFPTRVVIDQVSLERDVDFFLSSRNPLLMVERSFVAASIEDVLLDSFYLEDGKPPSHARAMSPARRRELLHMVRESIEEDQVGVAEVQQEKVQQPKRSQRVRTLTEKVRRCLEREAEEVKRRQQKEEDESKIKAQMEEEFGVLQKTLEEKRMKIQHLEAVKGLNAARARMQVYDQMKVIEEERKDILEHEMVADNKLPAPSNPQALRMTSIPQAMTTSNESTSELIKAVLLLVYVTIALDIGGSVVLWSVWGHYPVDFYSKRKRPLTTCYGLLC